MLDDVGRHDLSNGERLTERLARKMEQPRDNFWARRASSSVYCTQLTILKYGFEKRKSRTSDILHGVQTTVLFKRIRLLTGFML